MRIGVPKETFPGEKRVALVPAHLPQLKKAGFDVVVQAGAGLPAGFLDEEYRGKGATVVDSRDDVFRDAQVIAQVRSAGANPEAGVDDVARLREGQTIVAFCEPYGDAEVLRSHVSKGVRIFSMELMPRTTRAQSMDALSSAASLAGYRAVLEGAMNLRKIFPMMMTAAGTLSPAKVFVVGAGVAGLQAVATAKRLGAVVSAYDVRSVVREQIESLGGRFIELAAGAPDAEGQGGYAREQSAEEIRQQQEAMAKVVAEQDVVITTAAIPGKKAPVLITADMVRRMAPGSVVIDIAAERGGNCELTRAGETVEENDVRIVGPTNVAAELATHASQAYSKNVTNFVTHVFPKGEESLDLDDEITAGALLAAGGEIRHAGVRGALGFDPLPEPVKAPESAPPPPEKGE